MCLRRRGCHACHPHVIKFRHWAWYEWLTGVMILIALIYSLYGIISISALLYNMNRPPHLTENRHGMVLHYPAPALPLVTLFLVGHVLLLITTILGLLWLTVLRNMCIFLVTFVLLIIVILLYFMVGAGLVYSIEHDEYVKTALFHHVRKNINIMKYEMSFWAFQREHGCCGVRGFRDWARFGRVDWMTTGEGGQNVPTSCCIKLAMGMENCGVNALNHPDASKELDIINKRGCWEEMKPLYVQTIRNHEIEAFVVAFYLLALLFLLLYICHRLYLQLIRPRYAEGDTYTNNNGDGNINAMQDDESTTRGGRRTVRRNRRDDDRESYIVPGTPAKSLISDDERTFYAP